MRYYPVFLNLKGKSCVVVGGGRVAERKIRQLLKSGAAVTVISPSLTGSLLRLKREGRIRHIERKYRRTDAENAFLVIAATSDRAVNESVYGDGVALVNAVDMPEYCTFILPSILSRGALTLAISTSGTSPALARSLRKEIDTQLPRNLAKYLAYLGKARKRVFRALPGNSAAEVRKRSLLLKRLGSKKVLEILRAEGFNAVKAECDKLLQRTLRS